MAQVSTYSAVERTKDGPTRDTHFKNSINNASDGTKYLKGTYGTTVCLNQRMENIKVDVLYT